MLLFLLFQNYNKSRIHSFRGAKDIEMSLDGTSIFKGEINRACGGILGGSEAFGDVSLGELAICQYRTDCRFAPSQWETALLCNYVSHSLGANLESALQ